jgi:dTDP-glucose pyrophosphorylase
VDRRIIGVILAAGKGTRIQPLNMSYPKPLLPVCNKPIMQYQLEDMRSIGIDEVIIVVGHLKEQIMEYFGDGSFLGMRLRYVEQRETLGIAHAVAQLENEITTPFMLFLGDIFVVPQHLDEMVRMFWERRAGAILAVKREEDPEFIKRNFAVVLHASGTVTRVIEKPRHIPSNLKGCGIYIFDLAIFDAIRRTPRTAQRDEYEITNSIQILIEDGFPVYPAESVAWDMNVTYPCDLLECNRRQLRHLGLDKLIGERTEIHPHAEISHTVIGHGVRILHPIRIVNSMIFPQVTITDETNLEGVLVAPGYRTQCTDGER